MDSAPVTLGEDLARAHLILVKGGIRDASDIEAQAILDHFDGLGVDIA